MFVYWSLGQRVNITECYYTTTPCTGIKQGQSIVPLAGLKLKLLSVLKIHWKNNRAIGAAFVLVLMGSYGTFLSKWVDVTMLSLQLDVFDGFFDRVDYF